MKRKGLVIGTLILGIGGLLAKVLGFFFRIPLIYMIGEEGIGLYQLTYPLYTFILAVAAGIPTAISKMISERTATGKYKEAYLVFRAALRIMMVFGLLSTICLLLFAKKIMNALDWNQGAYYSLLGISLAPVFTCVLSAFKGYYQGLQVMGIPAASQVLEQLARIFVGVGLAWLLLPGGIAIAAGGASFGAAAGSLIGIIWMLANYRRNSLAFQEMEPTKRISELSLEIIRFSIPISLAQAIGSVMALLDSAMVPALLKSAGYSDQLATQLYGQLTGKAFVLVNIPLTLSIALAQSIVPAVAEAGARGDTPRLGRNIRLAYKLAMILAMPCAAGLFALSRPILSMIFRDSGSGWELMQILAVASVFIILAQTSTSILNGLGRLLLPVVAILVGAVVKIAINIVFIPDPALNIKAAAVGTLASYVVVAFLDFVFVLSFTKMRVAIYEMFVSPAVCTLVMIVGAVATHAKVFVQTGSNTVATLVAMLIACITYLLMLLITGTLRITELKAILKR